ncbi:hypothetical protein ACL6C3_22455 [Capilliphycus salinus ALCB114379]|uniref:hypothetical protein n=1 Tax=Capilliphycus salinus TaxID=2768948 RepID=UPI0039A5BF7C
MLFGNFGNDTIIGGIDDDCLYGGVEDDSLIGFDGDDYLSGDLDSDTLFGGEGEDSFVIGRGPTSIARQTDFILDFSPEDDDEILLTDDLRFSDLEIEDATIDDISGALIRIDTDSNTNELFIGFVVGLSENDLSSGDFRTLGE